jgi:hypothetical protein
MMLLVEVECLAQPLNIRRTLLTAVDSFLEASPASLTKAHRLIARCEDACPFFTLNDVVWGGFVRELTDSLFYESAPWLSEFRSLLVAGSHEIYRTYLNYNFDGKFTQAERTWISALHEMLDFLSGYPFPDRDQAISRYENLVAKIKQAMLQSPSPERLEEETIYHLILREASAILISVDRRFSALRSTHLVPNGPYTSYGPQPRKGRDTEPDISGDLDWTRRALNSIVEQGWLLLTWQVTPEHYRLSLH